MMLTWQKVWREGVAPQLSTAALHALRTALVDDDERLMQGSTTYPPPLQCMQDACVTGACPIGFGAWIGDGKSFVGQVEEFFARVCYETDRHFGSQAACRYFLNWVDDTPREDMRRLLLPEVDLALAGRAAAAA